MKIPSVALAALTLAPLPLATAQQFTVETAPADVWVAQAPEDEPPKLGVMVSETDDGVLISEILEDSLAEAAGLQAEDVLFRIGGERIDAIADIPAALGAYGPDDEVTVTVIRPGEGLVTLMGRRPAPEPAPQPPVVTVDPGGAFLGVEIGAAADGGVRVAGVFDHSAAWYVGLSDGDTLLELDGHELDSPEELAEQVGRHAPGDLVSMAYRHHGERYETRMRLGQRMPAGHPLGGFFAPQGNAPFGQPHGDLFFVDPDGEHEGLRFFGGDGDVALFGDDHGALKWLEDGRGKETHGRMQELLHRHLETLEHGDHHEDAHHDGGHEARELRIQIQDGVMTIDRDGEVEVIELENGSQDGQRTSFRIHGDDQDVVAQVVALTSDLEDECEALAAECDALVAECEALAEECEMACEVECEADAQVQTVVLTADASAPCDAVTEVQTAQVTVSCDAAEEACDEAAEDCDEVPAECDKAAEDCETACEDEAPSCCDEEQACDETEDDEDAVT